MRQRVTVVKVKSGTDISQTRTGEVIVLAVTSDGGSRVEWRTVDRPQIGDVFTCELLAAPKAVA